MKQIVQDLKNGATEFIELPMPKATPGHVLIRTQSTLISNGTERMLLNFGKANLLSKALQQPDRVKQVFQKIQTDGWKPTLEVVQRKLNTKIPLGYCHVGEIIDIGEGVKGLKIRDRVVSNGAHAEVVNVSEKLVQKIPDAVSDMEAVFTVPGAIALQGIRLAQPTFGETAAVFGLGLIGQMAVQLLRAQGCKVLALDVDKSKVELAEKSGAIGFLCNENAVEFVKSLTQNRGADFVIIAASNKDSSIIEQSAGLLRKRGRIVLIGSTGLKLNRADFYEKEISFQVSCSYGPGRYDPNFEEKNLDYPIGFVRWTAQRNFEAILEAFENKWLSIDAFPVNKNPFETALEVYENLEKDSALAHVFLYQNETLDTRNFIRLQQRKFNTAHPVIGIIGSGDYTTGLLLPALKLASAQVNWICGNSGIDTALAAKKFNIPNITSEPENLLNNELTNVIIISNRHQFHAPLALAALQKNKHVLVEKPLAIYPEELLKLAEVYAQSKGSLIVGYNRRYSTFSRMAKERLTQSPMNISMSINAGKIDSKSWIQDRAQGGGRIVGELCHWVDLACYFTDALVDNVYANSMGQDENDDNLSVVLSMKDGSNVNINYFSNGHPSEEKERIEIYQNGKIIKIENWKKISGFGFEKKLQHKSAQDKGHNTFYADFLHSIENLNEPIQKAESLFNVSATTFAAVKSIGSRSVQSIETFF